MQIQITNEQLNNLIIFMNRVTCTGIVEAQSLLELVQLFTQEQQTTGEDE